MSVSIDCQRLGAALEKARHDLLSEQSSDGHWEGRLSSSPTATAAALSALVIAEQYGSPEQHGRKSDRLFDPDQIFQSDLSELIVDSLHWLACHQNPDGGWGDSDTSRSDLAPTLLVNAAFHLTGVPAKYTGLLERAEAYIRQQGGAAALRKRHDAEKPLTAAILAHCALAGLIPWKEVPPLPYELAALPQSRSRLLRHLGIHYSLPELVAVGQARFQHAPPVNPIDRCLRRISRQRTLKALEQVQPESGGFLEGIPITSFVVMCLASIDLAEHGVVRRGVEFLLANVRSDGSWPLHVDLAVRNTALAVSALQSPGGWRLPGGDPRDDRGSWDSVVEWLLNCQRQNPDPYSHAAPGGWAWTDRSGGVPNAEDTATVLISLAGSVERISTPLRRRVEPAARHGVRWLLDLQNPNGGWATCCRGHGLLSLQRSSSDVTAQALRALAACKKAFVVPATGWGFAGRLDRSVQRGLDYLQAQQREDGSWVPLWFANQNNPGDGNPVCGTSRVLIALADLGYQTSDYKTSAYEISDVARRGSEWLSRSQHASGGWGPILPPGKPSWQTRRQGSSCAVPSPGGPVRGPSIEETSLAVTALARLKIRSPGQQAALERGLAWLIEAVENDRHREPASIGFHFARLWYDERLYPILFAVEALRAAAAAGAYSERGESLVPVPLQAVSP